MKELPFELTVTVGNFITLQASFRSLVAVLMCLIVVTVMLALLVRAIKAWKQSGSTV